MNVKTGTKLGPYSRTANNLILHSPTVFFTARSVVLRGIAMISCLSVCPSVTLVDCDHCDHTRWNSAKIISRVISLGTWLSADPNITDLLQREHL